MRVKDLLKNKVHTVDVYENVADLVGVAFEWDNTLKLTNEGEKHFKKALDYKVASIGKDILILDTVASVSKKEIEACDFEDTFPEATQNVIDFFWSIAGYCSVEDYDKWFEEVEQ